MNAASIILNTTMQRIKLEVSRSLNTDFTHHVLFTGCGGYYCLREQCSIKPSVTPEEPVGSLKKCPRVMSL